MYCCRKIHIYHCKAIINNKLYDTSKASAIFDNNKRRYYMTKNGNYFSVTYKSMCSEEYALCILSDIQVETEEAIRNILGKYNVEKYQTLFGEVEEA